MHCISKYFRYIIVLVFAIFIGNLLNAQSNKDSINYEIPSLEEFAYPFQNLNFISPRYSQVKNLDGSIQSTFLLRTVFTIPNLPFHFRVELPYATNKGTQKTTNGLGDISLRSTYVFHQQKRWLAGIALKAILPTAKYAAIGNGDFQLNPEIGFLKVFPRSKGSVGLSVDYLFSAGKNKFNNIGTSVLGLSPTIDYWGKKMQIGYYPAYTYNFKTKEWIFPFDVELGIMLQKNWWARFELILPMGKNRSNESEFLIKLRYDF